MYAFLRPQRLNQHLLVVVYHLIAEILKLFGVMLALGRQRRCTIRPAPLRSIASVIDLKLETRAHRRAQRVQQLSNSNLRQAIVEYFPYGEYTMSALGRPQDMFSDTALLFAAALCTVVSNYSYGCSAGDRTLAFALGVQPVPAARQVKQFIEAHYGVTPCWYWCQCLLQTTSNVLTECPSSKLPTAQDHLPVPQIKWIALTRVEQPYPVRQLSLRVIGRRIKLLRHSYTFRREC